jgi:hypothetical protein
MFDQILDSYHRRAAESTAQFQMMLLRNWVQQWPQMVGFSNPGAAWFAQAQAARKKWGETITAMLNEHREVLDAQYRAGIKIIEDAFRVGEARDPEQFRRLTEELWKHSIETLKTVAEEQRREFQDVMQKWFELVSRSTASVKL